ncbi:hypothetical protein FRC14_004946 [Serendipita sp. 396]|nr:hypothetical protein FRC14_004946 [Serendipita sp. 396]KAG8781537.1 hypothetical protein FRC15_008581 [Serendipita sp. 397]KAG8825572.1 hypothetical protein FRC19_011104 [Serendipita sp. 401]KAG8836258.1 hypothetical protein FRC18_011649 [Serendipita sp. 400]KAG9055557.1 hypothetical protein FS842_001874 [Serendipita sp. 407]
MQSQEIISQARTLSSISNQPAGAKHFGSLFALIIGIDEYAAPEVAPLLGAVADARAMKCYLRDKLCVPEANIRTLLDTQATRSDIIKGIRELTNNPSITRNDPILIFYAGHGTEATPPKDWDAEQSKIEMIVPQDYRMMKDGKRVHCIPDLSIGILLEDLANAKGNNITVILDCCHSGSGTRDGHRRVRSVKDSEDIPNDLDIDIWGTSMANRVKIPPEFKYLGSASHLLLAACASNQSAMENNGRGVFTQALLETITTLGVENLTYATLIKHLPDLPGQQPRCEGRHRNRFLFTKKIQDGPFYELKKSGEAYVLEAGSVHGVTKEAEFALYKAADIHSKHPGKLTVLSVGSTTSTVELHGVDPVEVPPAFASPTSFGKAKALRIYLSDNRKLDSLRYRIQREIESRPDLYILANPEEAQLHIQVHDHEETATFALANALVQTLGLTQIPFRVSLREEDVIIKVIEATYAFNLYLNNHPANLDIENHGAKGSYQEPVSIHFTKLEKQEGNRWSSLAPAAGGENLNKNNQVDIVSGETRYGLKITNNTEGYLYPYLFLFNCNDLSIASFYTPPTTKYADRDASLQKGGSITVGYGDGGGRPWRHMVQPAQQDARETIVRDEEDLQVEFFKLILTTKPVDLSFIEQHTPFGKLHNRVDRGSAELVDKWETVLVAVVVKRQGL